MSKLIKLVVVGTLLSALMPVCGFAANRLLYENFNDRALDSRLNPRIYGAVATPPQYTFVGPGRDGTGYCFSSGTVDDVFLQWPSGRLPRPWPSDELYMSFWMRYPTFRRSDLNENIKIFYPHWDGGNSYVHFTMVDTNTVYYSARARNSSMVSVGTYMTCPNMADGNWHHYEFHVKFSEGISRFRYDGVQKLDHRYGPGVWTNNIHAVDAPSMDGEEPGIFSRQVDDWEVWDGMPDTGTQAAGPPSVPADVSVQILR